MSYRDILSKQILELEQKISKDTAEKEILQQQLNKLRIAEFEEDMRETQEKKLLQEGC